MKRILILYKSYRLVNFNIFFSISLSDCCLKQNVPPSTERQHLSTEKMGLGSAWIPIVGCVLLVVAITLHVLSFASPYWVEDTEGDFGLWRRVVCVDKESFTDNDEGCYRYEPHWDVDREFCKADILLPYLSHVIISIYDVLDRLLQ